MPGYAAQTRKIIRASRDSSSIALGAVRVSNDRAASRGDGRANTTG